MFNYFNNGELKLGKVIAHAVIVLLVLVFLFGSFGTVGAGYVGVRTRFGSVVGTVQPGLYFKLPVIEHVISMDVQTQKEQAAAEAASADLQDVQTTIAVNYNLIPASVSTLYSDIGVDYQSRVIDPAIQESVKSATAKYTAEELITKRPSVRDDILKSLTDTLAPKFITVSDVSIVDFKFSESFNQAIEAKVTAEQNALAAKNKLDQVKYEAEQTITTAQAQAEAIKIQAQAINSQGGADYVRLQAIKAWKGDLPQYMIPGAVLPFLGNVSQ